MRQDFPGFRLIADHADHGALVRQAMFLLGQRRDLRDQLRIDPEPRKKPGDHWNVFNFRGSRGGFTESPQLLLWVGHEEVCARAILPYKARKLWTRLRKFEGLDRLMQQVLQDMGPAIVDCVGMKPDLVLKQRHWRPRGRPPFQDAHLEVDLRTLRGDPALGVKQQSEWMDAVKHVIRNKNGDCNFEFQVGAAFRYEHCPAISEPDALDHIAAAWIGCRSFIEWLRRHQG